jgi:hypothetical protein
MTPLVLVVEDDEDQGPEIRNWIATAIPSVEVQWTTTTREAEQILLHQTSSHPIRCIVLDMFFTTALSRDEAGGQVIIDHYQTVPIILISDKEAARKLTKPADDIPLIRLEKPARTQAGTPIGEFQKEEFRRLLIEAVRSGLKIASLEAQIANQAHGIRQFRDLRVWRALILLIAALLLFAVATELKSELAQHFFLAVGVVLAVHLFERVWLFKDVLDQFDSVKEEIRELSGEIRRKADKKPRKGAARSSGH